MLHMPLSRELKNINKDEKPKIEKKKVGVEGRLVTAKLVCLTVCPTFGGLLRPLDVYIIPVPLRQVFSGG